MQNVETWKMHAEIKRYYSFKNTCIEFRPGTRNMMVSTISLDSRRKFGMA